MFNKSRNNTILRYETKYLLFVGEKIVDIVRIISRYLSQSRKVLIYDASHYKRILLSTIGIESNYFNINGLHYTSELTFLKKYKKEYEIILVYGERMADISGVSETVECSYICGGANTYSLFILEKALKGLKDYNIRNYSLIFRDKKEEIEKKHINELWRLQDLKCKSPQDIFYLSSDENDVFLASLWNCGFDMNYLSSSMLEIVHSISSHTAAFSRNQIC